VLLISFPHHLLHAIAALVFERRRTGVPEKAPATFLVWSFKTADHAFGSDFRRFLALTLRLFPQFAVCFPSRRERLWALSPYRLIRRRAAWIRQRLGSRGTPACYFSHDASADHTAQALLQAFPEGRRICFGDPPGFLHSPFTAARPTIVDGGWLRNTFWGSRLRGISEIYRADMALVAIDFLCDTGSELHGAIERVPRGVFLEVLADLAGGLAEDGTRCGVFSWAGGRDGRPQAACLLVLGNFAASRMMSPESELSLYQDICATLVPEGSTVYLKPHYGMSVRMTEYIRRGLAGYGAELLPEALRQVPVELLTGLPGGKCRILSVSSSSALIAHLYGENVVHALTTERIERYFRLKYVRYMRDSNQAVIKAVVQAQAVAQAG